MRALIIPCLGRRIINGVPQYLNRHPNGELLIERSIEGVFSEDYNRLLIVLLEEDVQKHNADHVIAEELINYPIEIVTLEEMTSGPAETIYQAIKKANVTGSLVIKDADNYLKTEQIPYGNFVAGLDLNTWERDIHNLRNKSFLVVNEQGNILDIIEKQVRSDVICLGLYGFKNASDFVNAYERLNDASYPISKLYVSHIVSYLIGYSGRVFRYVKSLEYENWGNEHLWKDLQRCHALYFIDLDNVLDLAGTLSQDNVERMAFLQSRGASIVGFTVKGEEYKTAVLKDLRGAGLNFVDVICGCPHSERKEIIRSAGEIKQKAIEL